MVKLTYNKIAFFAVLAFVLGPVSVSPAFARPPATVGVGVVFHPVVDNTVTTINNSSTTNNSTNTSSTDANTSSTASNSNTSNTNNTSTTTSNTRTLQDSSNNRTIDLTRGVSERFTTSNYQGVNSGTYNLGTMPTGSDINSEYGKLTANAVMGSNGFWPSGIYQWILMFIIIIVIITLIRYIRRSRETYMEVPLKHA